MHSVLLEDAELKRFSDLYNSLDVSGFFRAIFPVMLFMPTCVADPLVTDDTGGVSGFFFLKTVVSRLNISRLQSERFLWTT